MRDLRTTAKNTLVLTVVLLVAAAPARSETLFQATLDESQNVPPTGSVATGTATLILNDAQTEVSYVVTYANLEGNELDAHFHKAPPGENGSIVHFLPLGTPKFGTWTVTTHDVADLFAGLIYVNIHTEGFIGGEIRGNISESATGLSAEPTRASWGRIKAMFE